MENTRYIVIFIAIMTGIVAVSLTGLRQSTKSIAEKNEEVFDKRAILAAVKDFLDKPVNEYTDEEVLGLFEENIEQYSLNLTGEVIDQGRGVADDIDLAREADKPEEERALPLYVYDNGEEKLYILSVRGRGLWDAIWGTVALREDLVTVAGASFDHAGETPGLGAEIKDNPAFAAQFSGKRIYSAYNGEYTAVIVRKGGARNPEYEVDGISGATVTADGVTEMIQRGIKYYEPYLEQLRESETLGMK